MHGFLRWPRGAALGLTLLALAGCESRIPTASGTDLFPDGTTPQSIDFTVPASDFLVSDTVFEGYSSPAQAPYVVVARAFRGSLTAHALARFTGFPDSVVYSSGGTSTTTKDFTYGSGQVISVVDSAASFPPAPVTLQLWSLEQAYDSSTATWTQASAGEAWRTPGGTLGTLLAETEWTPGDSAKADSVVWDVDSLAVARLAAAGSAGVAVTASSVGSRLQMGLPTLRTGIRPSEEPDTLISIGTILSTAQTTVFTPAVPTVAGNLRAGGPTSDRVVLRILLPDSVPGCAGATACGDAAIGGVTLNYAKLDLRTLGAPDGFGPVTDTQLQVRRVLEPELGRRAPLGEVIDTITVHADAFEEGGEKVSLNLTDPARAALADGKKELAIALIAVPTSRFAYLWFTTAPGLRLVYTLPQNLSLP